MIPRIHANDHAIGPLEIIEGELERFSHGLLVIAHSTCCQDFEGQAGLVDLPDYTNHIEWIGGEERFADLDRNHRRLFFQFLWCSGDVVEASHE